MYLNYYSAQNVYQEQMRDERREVETWRLLRNSGLDRRGLLSHAACGLVCGLGRLLVRTGESLQRAVSAEASRTVMGGGANARLAG